ncbi:hypothetical protein QFC20_005791 [Naganishia adeliensis]|uniref:Uncharacterized protein n=1 Tax=Naganishia adeliensis TaxID=92952 RepID=A0ACC2VIY2_9TREE|nr:hypothetical protein QFC20_005791 [Naganishia adeliensis]
MYVLNILRLLSPAVVLPLSLSLLTPRPPPPSELPGIRPIVTQRIIPRRLFILLLLCLINSTYLVDGAVFVAQTCLEKEWLGDTSTAWTVYSWGNVVVWAGTSVLVIWKSGYDRNGLVLQTLAGMVLECVILGFQARDVAHMYRPSIYIILHLVAIALRIILLPILLWAISSPIVTFQPVTPTEETETDPLLRTDATLNGEGYGAVDSNGSGQTTAPGTSASSVNGTKKDKSDGPKLPPPPHEQTWKQWFARFMKIVPYLWPRNSRKLQLLALACLGLLVLGRGVNVLVPQLLGRVIRALGTYDGDGGRLLGDTWRRISCLRLCQGGSGMLAVMQNMLWAPVMQYSDREMSNMCFNHLLDLSLSFHTKRKTGEVLRILDRGSAINSFFQTLLFSVLPVLFDISIAIAVFYFVYGWMLAAIIGIVMFSYIFVSITLTTWRTKLRREMNDRDIITRGIHTDVLMNWETVKYFTSEARESARYRSAIQEYQVKELQVVGSLNLLNLTQNFIITSGLLAGSLVVSYRIAQGQADASEFVVFITYLGQLYAPLHMLGMIYRQLNSGMVDAEKLLRLLEEETEIVDKPEAKDLEITDGVIEFRDVHFSYDGKVKALDGVSFKVDKGSSIALVGESGSGKSTILRLLFRFYEIGSGAITIDGQDIRDVTQKSLRKALGVVPQESVLWNDTIEFNIGYGREGASKEEIIEAAKAARLHDRIMSFPDQYNTVVGERGVRLSGGEKQRVALARTILKEPAILVLDEATSALDTENERLVQQALEKLVRLSPLRALRGELMLAYFPQAEGRSSLMIAHRLSTIVSCDQIIVMRNGKIIERGNHKELLTRDDGVFASMWNQQITIDDKMVEEVASAKAEKLLDVKIPDELYHK